MLSLVGVVILLLSAGPGFAGAQDARPPDAIQSSPGAARPRDPATGPRDRAPGEAEEASGIGRISGRVFRGDTGAALRGAFVTLRGDGLEESRSTTTDAEGKYQLTDLPAGRFHLSAGKGGFVGVEYGQRRPHERGRPIEVDGRQHLANVNLTLPRGSVIAGRITDEFGDAVSHLTVAAVQHRYFAGRRQLVPSHGAETDDRGQYRIFGLPPGDYYVSAAESGMSFGVSRDGRSGIAPTYYPGTPALAEAQRVRLGVGEEHVSVNFAVLPVRTSNVSGVVLDSTGSRARGGFVVLQPAAKDGSAPGWRGGGGGIRPDGTFKIGGVPPDDYTVHANVAANREAMEYGSVPITVASEDIDGLTIVTSAGSRVTGQLVFETPPPDSVKPSDFRIVLRPDEPMTPNRGVSPFTPEEDWSFETRAYGPPAFFHAWQTPAGWTLKAVLHGGVDVLDTGLEFTPGAPLEGIQLVISNRFGAVSGSVNTAEGRPAADYTVVVFADDSTRWGLMSRYVATTRPSQRGTFEISKLPPARYLAAAVEYLEEGQHTDPEYLERLRGYATAFEIRDSERRTLSLELVNVD